MCDLGVNMSMCDLGVDMSMCDLGVNMSIFDLGMNMSICDLGVNMSMFDLGVIMSMFDLGVIMSMCDAAVQQKCDYLIELLMCVLGVDTNQHEIRITSESVGYAPYKCPYPSVGLPHHKDCMCIHHLHRGWHHSYCHKTVSK